jgi:TolA-binding protein
MKNGSISEQLNMQEQIIKHTQDNQQNISSGEKEKKQAVNAPDLGLSSVLGILTPEPGNEEQPLKPPKKKKKPNKGIRRG